MKHSYFVLSLILFVFTFCEPKKGNETTQDSLVSEKNTPVTQEESLSAAQKLLEKSIKFHDPESNWAKFNSKLMVTSKRPNGSTRRSYLEMNNSSGLFMLREVRDSAKVEQGVINDSCVAKINGVAVKDSTQQAKYRLTCKRTKLMRNYYGYLYGLPMKLKDKGTIVSEKVSKVKFQDKECLSIKVTYDSKVGKDTWYFYFNPTSYALVGYRFYHDESKNDGEYITLEGLETLQGIKMPKTRAWYYNKDDKFLGKDILEIAGGK